MVVTCSRSARLMVGLLFLAFHLAAGGHAEGFTWSGTAGGGNNDWFTSVTGTLTIGNNWTTPNATMNVYGNIVTFGAVPLGASVTPFLNNTGETVIRNLTFTSTAPAYTLTGTTGLGMTLYETLSNSSAFLQSFTTNTVHFLGGATVDTGTAGITMSSTANTGELTKIGSGALTLSGDSFGISLIEGPLVLTTAMPNSYVFQNDGMLTGTFGPGANAVRVGELQVYGGTAVVNAVQSNLYQADGEIVFSSGTVNAVMSGVYLNGANSISGTVGSKMTFLSNVTLGTSSRTTLDLAGTGVADTYAVDGLLTYGGTLSLNFTVSGTQAVGTTWSVFDPLGGVSGSFATVAGAGVGPYAGLSWTLASSSTNVIDQKYGNGVWLSSWTGSDAGAQRLVFDQSSGDIVIVPEPSTIAMAGAGVAVAAVTRWWRRRRRGGKAGEEAVAPSAA